MSAHKDLSQKDKDSIKYQDENNPVVKYLRNQDHLRFQIGDVLVRQKRSWRSPEKEIWETETVSNVSKAPKKFVYVAENQFGVGYIKQLRANGKGFTDGEAICLANIEFGYTRYVVDPDFQDHMLLDGDQTKFEYNTSFKEDRARRQSILKENKKLLEPTDTALHIEQIVNKLKVGDKFWMGWDVYQCVRSDFTVKAIRHKPLSQLRHWEQQSWDKTTSNCYEVVVEFKDSYDPSKTRTDTFDTFKFINQKVILVPPTPFEDALCE